MKGLAFLGIPLDALRAYQASGGSQYTLATSGGQAIQQPALYAAQLQAIAQQQQQQQAAQLAAAVKQQQQQQQQQQQNFLNSIPAGYALVRTANGGYALLAQNTQASAASVQQQQQQQQQQYISFNAAGQGTGSAGRLPMAMLGGQGQQIVYQYANQSGMQGAPTQYIQVPANYGQQQASVGSSLLPGTNAAAAASQGSSFFEETAMRRRNPFLAYASQPSIQYIGAPSTSNASNSSAALSPSSSTLVSPQKQSAASATAAAIQQQQQYQYAYSQQQQSTANGSNAYYATMAQAQSQQQQQQQLAANALAQQQQQLNLISQVKHRGLERSSFFS